jgi:uncharacterized protein
MEFEFDLNKSAMNREKHGLDFVDAQSIWLDEDRALLPLTFVDEERFMMIGRIDTRLWSAVFTWRGLRIRIISARRAREDERQHYEG